MKLVRIHENSGSSSLSVFSRAKVACDLWSEGTIDDIETMSTRISPHRCSVHLISRVTPRQTGTISKPCLLNVQPFVETIQSTLRRALGISKTEARVRKSSDFQPIRTVSRAELSNCVSISMAGTSPIAREGAKETKSHPRSLSFSLFLFHISM